ncbi:hydrolase of HAD-superfamily protein [Salinisphaera sp. S4-8]
MAGEVGPAELIAYGDRRQAPPLDVLAQTLEVGLDEVHVYSDVPPVLEALSGRGYRLATASNLVAPFGRALERELGAWMDGFALSYEVGALKPDRRMFEAAARHLEMSADQILVVGDSVTDDIEGAHALGMASIQVDRSGTVADTIASLEPLLSLLSKPADTEPPHF